MLKKYIYIILAALLLAFQSNAQVKPGGSRQNQQTGSELNPDDPEAVPNDENEGQKEKKVPSIIKSWEVLEQGTLIQKTEVDTALTFYHIYNPVNKNSISSTFTGNNGGAFISNDFFNRKYNSDCFFSRSFDGYLLTPSQIKYFNTTTPYSILDYSQSENRTKNNETRFNVFISQNVNKKLNFELVYNQTRSQGQYLNQENKFHNIALVSSYDSNNFLSHSNLIFNRLETQENGGIDSNQSLNQRSAEDFTVRMDDAKNKLRNNNLYTVNEYRLGKTIEADTTANSVEKFIPRVGFIHELDISSNSRKFTREKNADFFKHSYFNSDLTADSLKYTRVSNLFQIKFYEAPDRKYTFGKRVYIGHSQMSYHMATLWDYIYLKDQTIPEKYSNTFVGGGIFRNKGKFWQFEANGRIYISGYSAGQTELSGFLNKPLKIGKDTTSFRIEGSLKTSVPEYFDLYYFSNHFLWKNNFNNIKDMTIKASIHSQEYKTTVGANYSLIGNYIYNNTNAMPAQAGGELLVLSAYLNKDFESDHWMIRTQMLVQKSGNENYLHLPAFAGFISMNYRTLVSKVLHFQLGIDTRYNTEFYADAYDPATSRFYLQNEQKIGNYPFIDLHANVKLKRTRIFFLLMNAASGVAGNNFFVAPDYLYYRRTFRLGVAWSFYD